MSEDPEELMNQEDNLPEQPQTETPESAPDLSQTADGDLSGFRQALAEEEAADAAAKTRSEKRPGIIRRMTGLLNRGSGRLDERNLPSAKEQPAGDAGLEAAAGTPESIHFPENSQQPQDLNLSNAADDSEMDAKLANLWPDPPAQPSGEEASGTGLAAEAVAWLTDGQEETGEIDSLSGAEMTPGDSPELGTPVNPELPGEVAPAVDFPMSASSVDSSPAAVSPTPVEELSKPDSAAIQPRRAPSLRRLVTGILMPSKGQKKEDVQEIMPDEQIADRLKSAAIESTERPTVPVRKIGKTGSFDLGETAQPDQLAGETPSAEDKTGISPYSGDQPATDADRALWGAYVDNAAGIPARPAEPSPFVEEVHSPESGEGSIAELMLSVGTEGQPASPENNAPFVDTGLVEASDNADVPWLGELRGEISTDDDLLTPTPVPEVEVPPEKSDIWDRLFAEQERGSQFDGPPGTRPLENVTDELDSQDIPPIKEEAEVDDIPYWAAEPKRPTWADQAEDPAWSDNERDKTTDGYGNWYEETAEDDSGLLGLPEPSQEASEELRESNKLYDSIFEEQKQQEMRTVLLGEEVNPEVAQPVEPMPDFSEEPEEKPKPWWARLTAIQKVLIVGAAVLVFAIIALAAFYLYPRGGLPAAAPQPTAVQVDVNPSPNGPYPIGVELTGGWIFSLKSSTRVEGRWTPQGGEWLDGTQIRRVIALPWNRQTEAVARSFLPGDEIRLYFSNKQTIVYKVTEIKQVPVDDVSVMSDTHPSLAIILYQAASTQRWVIIAIQ